MFKTISVIIVAIVAVASSFAAAPDSIVWTHFSVKNGLPSNHVYSVTQDKQGYTWFFTDNGLVKHNGYTFKLFNTSTGLPSSDVWNSYEDSSGRLWLGTYAYEIGYIKNDIYHKVDIDTKASLVRIGQIVEKNGYIYIWTGGGLIDRVFVVDSADNVKTFLLGEALWPHSLTDSIIIGNGSVLDVYKATGVGLRKVRTVKSWADRIRTNTSFSPMLHYKNINYAIGGTQLQFVDVQKDTDSVVDIRDFGASALEKLYTIYVHGDKFYILTNHQLFILSENFRLVKRLPYKNILPVPAQLTYYFPNRNSNSWYTTSASGCYLTYEVPNRFRKSDFLNTNLAHVRLVGRFKDGTSWWFDELDLVLSAVDNIGNIVLRKSVKTRVEIVSEDIEGNAMLVLANDVLILDLKHNVVRQWVDTNLPFYVHRFWHTFDYSQKLKKNNQGREELIDEQKKPVFIGITAAHQYRSGKVYTIGYFGLRSIAPGTDSVIIETIDGSRYTGIYYDSVTDRYWFYNRGRIAIVNPKNNEYRVLDNSFLKGLSLNSISSIRGDRFYNIYIQSADRLLVYNTRLGSFRTISVDISIADAKMEMYNDILVFAGKFGLAYASIQGPLKISEFSIIPNVKEQFYSRLYNLVIAKSGDMILHTDAGFLTLDYNNLTAGNKIIANERLVVSSPFYHAINGNDTIHIDPSSNVISIDYINYYGKGNRIFRYRIGDESEWQQTTSGEIFLASLKPETYSKVYCQVSDDMWKSKLYSLHIYRVPYWYQTATWYTIFWIAGVILFATIILIVVLITRTIIANANEKKRMQVELELRAIHAQINPHFIFNTLSSALYFINNKRIDEAYSHVSKFSKLLRSYIKASRNRYTVLAEELEILNNYVELQRIRFENKFEYIVEVDKRIPVNSIQIPSLLLQPLVENAINHGLFHRGAGGLLILKFEQGASSDELICYIDDNGIGREKSKEIRKKSIAEYESYGNKLTEELIALFRKYERMDITVEYIDKQEPKTGTIVKLTIRNMKYVA